MPPAKEQREDEAIRIPVGVEGPRDWRGDMARNGLPALVQRDSELGDTDVRFSKLNASVCAAEPEELKHDTSASTHQSRLVRLEPKVQGARDHGSRQRRSANRRKRRSTFHLTEPSTGEAQELPHGWGSKTEVHVSLVDRAHIRLKRTGVHLILLLQKSQIKQNRRLRGWHGAKRLVPELQLNFRAEAEEAIELALV
jgi:hypothetical protein